jgi:predicted polyphosphate/ATP-dependent NAD kinase
MMKIGLIVNPIAGIGGRVGLKGSDGEFAKKAAELGGRSPAPQRAVEALQEIANAKIEIAMLTYPSEMGEEEAIESGIKPVVRGTIVSGQTTANDTRRAVEDLIKDGAELLLFSGGDGTARNIMELLDEKIPIIGIPAGVKMHSGVFAINPRLAGKLATSFIKEETSSRRVEVVDYDKHGNLKLFGYMLVPFQPGIIQETKSYIPPSEGDDEAIAAGIIEELVNDCAYIIGPGMTTKSILQSLGLPYTLLGIDVIRNKQLLIKDANEQQLLDVVSKYDSKVLIGVIGGQGFLLGRGNQQISPDVMKKIGKENLIALATEEKLLSLKNRPLLIDTGDLELDHSFVGYMRVVTGYRRAIVWRVAQSA